MRHDPSHAGATASCDPCRTVLIRIERDELDFLPEQKCNYGVACFMKGRCSVIH